METLGPKLNAIKDYEVKQTDSFKRTEDARRLIRWLHVARQTVGEIPLSLVVSAFSSGKLDRFLKHEPIE